MTAPYFAVASDDGITKVQAGMVREPDWEVLADIQFLIYKRVADSLNAALSAVALSDMPNAGDQPPAYWRERATTKVANVLNLFTAWEYLLRYKMGETVPERAIRPFAVNALLAWLGHQLQLSAPPTVEDNPLLHANQETLQEALLLLYSAAFTQGSNVRLELESSPQGIWFRIKFARVGRALPDTFDELLASFGDHWRARDAVFELMMARDFVRLNGSELSLHSSATQGELVFFIWRAGVKRGAQPALEATRPLAATGSGAITRVMAETDLPAAPTTPKKPITGPIQPADPTPVLPPPAAPPKASAAGDETPPPRLADLRPPRFPLPATVFGPDTQIGRAAPPPASPAGVMTALADDSPTIILTPPDAPAPDNERATDRAGTAPPAARTQDDQLSQAGENPSPASEPLAGAQPTPATKAPPAAPGTRTAGASASDHTPLVRLTPPRPDSVAPRPAAGSSPRSPRPAAPTQPPAQPPAQESAPPDSAASESPAGSSGESHAS